MCRSYEVTASTHIPPFTDVTFNYYMLFIKDVYIRFVPLQYFLFGVPCFTMLVVTSKAMSPTVVLSVSTWN